MISGNHPRKDQPATRPESRVCTSPRMKQQVIRLSITVGRYRFVSTRGHVKDLQQRIVIGRQLVIQAWFDLPA